MAHPLRLPFALLRPHVVTIPVRPGAEPEPVAAAPAQRAHDFPRRDPESASLPALWQHVLPARPSEPFGSRRPTLRRHAAAWPQLAAIEGEALPEPNVAPADPAAWRVADEPAQPSTGWAGHEPPSPAPDDERDRDESVAEDALVPDWYELEPVVPPAAPEPLPSTWLGTYVDDDEPLSDAQAAPEPAVEPYEPAPEPSLDLDEALASWFSSRAEPAEDPAADDELVPDCYLPSAAADTDASDEPERPALPAALPAELAADRHEPPAGGGAPEPTELAEGEPEDVAEAAPEAEVRPADEPAAVPADVEPETVAVVAPPAPTPKVPLHRRELHLPRPRRRRGGRSRGGDVVGLRVGSTQIAAAHVHVNGGFELVQLARTPLAPGVVVGGEVREPAALAAALRAFFAEHKLPRRNVRLGVASGRIGVRVLEIPPVDDPRQLENAIRFRAHEEIPIPVAEAVLDHVVIGDTTDAEGNPIRRILVAFAHRDLVLRQVEACRKAGLRPLGVDLDAFALLRAVTRTEDSEGGSRALVAVSVGHERTVLAVSDGSVCEFTRVLEWGGVTLDVALARALDLSPSEANAVKHRLSLAGDGDAGLTPLQLEAARGAARLELQNLAREIVSSLRYYQTRPGALDLGEILVTGGASQLPGALAELEAAIGAPVRAGDPLARVTLGKRVQRPADAGSYAIAVGLGLDR